MTNSDKRRLLRRNTKSANDERFRVAANDDSYRVAANDESYRVAANDSRYSKNSTKVSSSSTRSSPSSKTTSSSAPAPRAVDDVLRASPNSGTINPPNYYGDGERLYRTAQTNIVRPRPNFVTVGEPYGDNHGRLVGKPYSTNYPAPFRGTSVVPVSEVSTVPNFTLEGEPYSSEPNFRTVGKPYTPTNLPAEYAGTNVVPYTGNGAVAEPSLLSRAGNFLGNVAKAGFKALPFVGAGYELFGNNNPVNAAVAAGSAITPWSLLFYSSDIADDATEQRLLREWQREQYQKEAPQLVTQLGHQVGELLKDLPAKGETTTAAPAKEQTQQVAPATASTSTITTSAPATSATTTTTTPAIAATSTSTPTSASARRRRQAASPMETAIATPSPREQLMARRAAALEAARAQQQQAAAQYAALNAPKPGFNPSGYATGHEAYYDPYKGQLLFR